MYWSGSAFSYQPSISDSITSTRPVGENAAANQRGGESARRGAARRRVPRVFLFYQSRGKFDGVRGNDLEKNARVGKGKKKKERIKQRIYYHAHRSKPRSRNWVSTAIYYLSIFPALSLARKSIFVTADRARLDSRGWNESEMNEGCWEKRCKGRRKRRRDGERAKDGDEACQLAWARIITFTFGRRPVCQAG